MYSDGDSIVAESTSAFWKLGVTALASSSIWTVSSGISVASGARCQLAPNL
jgi:hypothetical protein